MTQTSIAWNVLSVACCLLPGLGWAKILPQFHDQVGRRILITVRHDKDKDNGEAERLVLIPPAS